MTKTNLRQEMSKQQLTQQQIKDEINRKRLERGKPYGISEHTITGIVNNDTNWVRGNFEDVLDVLGLTWKIVKK